MNALERVFSAEVAAVIEAEIDRRVRDVLDEVNGPSSASPFMTISEAAEYLRAKPQRVYDLVSDGRLTRHRDGSRVLVRRDELDRYLNGGREAK
jgi:excisionase family DNA binding protein